MDQLLRSTAYRFCVFGQDAKFWAQFRLMFAEIRAW
jgi:hypothetical protein